MAQLIEIGEIKNRANAIGVSLKRLAQHAGVAHSNVYRAAQGKSDLRTRTLRLLVEALDEREREVAAHLIAQMTEGKAA